MRASQPARLLTPAALDPGSPLPLYAQLRQHLETRLDLLLRSGEARPGDFFTTEKDLSLRFGVSVITAKRALDDLEAEGRLLRQRGRGTFIAQPRLQQVLDHFYRFTTWIEEHGLEPASRTLATRTSVPDLHVARALGLKSRVPVFEIDRLRLVNGEPYFLQTSYVPLRRLRGIDRLDHSRRGLYEILAADFSLPPSRCTDVFEPVTLGPGERKLLQTPAGVPGLRLERTTFSGDIVVEFSRGVLRGDRCRLRVDLS